jgi:hypothetical protein
VRNSTATEGAASEARAKRTGTAVLAATILGSVIGTVAFFARRIEWVFIYLLGAPWLFSDILGDPIRAGSWLFPVITLCYFAALSGAEALFFLRRRSLTWRFGVTALILGGHLILTIAGGRRLFTELANGNGGALPAPEIWPKKSAPR